eukprot:gene14625-16140_t
MPDDNPAVDHDNQEQSRSSFALFRRPEKYKIGDDFDLFVKKSNLYFEAVELTDKKKRRLALLFNLSEDAFRLAESIEFIEEDNAYDTWITQLKALFERNQTLTEKRHNFHRRTQEPGESVDSFAVALREFGAKCGFQGEEYTNRLVDQFILGMKDRPTQNKLLQEPPESLEDAVLIARRFEAANSTIQTLRAEAGSAARQNHNQVGAVSSNVTAQTCFNCNGFGHVAKQCPMHSEFKRTRTVSSAVKTCYSCHRPGHLARNCFSNSQNQNPSVSSGINESRPPPTCYRCGRKGHISRFCHAEKETSTETGRQGQSPSQENRDGPQTESKVRLSTVSPSHKKKTLLLEAKVNGVNKLCIVDTGASISLISKREWESLMLNEESLRPSDIVAEAANNSPIGILGKVNSLVEVNGAHEINQEF